MNVAKVAAMKPNGVSPVDAAMAPISTGGIPKVGMRNAAA